MSKLLFLTISMPVLLAGCAGLGLSTAGLAGAKIGGTTGAIAAVAGGFAGLHPYVFAVVIVILASLYLLLKFKPWKKDD